MQNFNPPPHFSMKRPSEKKEVVRKHLSENEGFFARLLQPFKKKKQPLQN